MKSYRCIQGLAFATAISAVSGCAIDIEQGQLDAQGEVAVSEEALAAAGAIVADGYVRDGKYAGSGFGKTTSLVLKTTSQSNYMRRAYLKLDLSQLTSTVTQAKLRLHGRFDLDAGGSSVAVAVLAVPDSSWDEASLTWNGAPSLGSELATSVVQSGATAWYEWDVTSFVAAERAKGKTTASLALRTKSNTSPTVTFDAREASSNGPQLIVSVAAPAPGPTPPPPPVASGVYRPFSADSPWNTPIAATPRIDPASADMIADWTTSSPYGSFLGINIDNYSVPLYWTNGSSVARDVRADIGGQGWVGDNGFNATASVPMPLDAAPDPESDGHMLIVDRERAQEWGFYRASRQGNQWSCALCAAADLKGTGVRPVQVNNRTWYTSHGPRACGFPLIAGLIRTEEIEAGVIDHALVVAYPHIRAGLYTPPASTAQTRIGSDAVKTRGIPCGGRVQLDPTLNLDTLGLSRSGKIIARALQKYGAYVGDFSGSMSLYAENAPAALAYWRGGKLQTQELRNKVDLRSFRVLELGTLYDDHNAD